MTCFHDGQNEVSIFHDRILKPLPQPIIDAYRTKRGRLFVRDELIKSVLIANKKTSIAHFTGKLNFFKQQYKKFNKIQKREGCLVGFRVEGCKWLPDGQYTTNALIKGIEDIESNLKDERLQQHIFHYLYNRDKTAIEKIDKIKDMYGELLEAMGEDKTAFYLTQYKGNKTIYTGIEGQEQNYIKLAELLQDRCNMFNNLVAILL
tara:strand:- start:47 stop:661 length:615 start_codon:yes stop_codon:yes gene_type:complete